MALFLDASGEDILSWPNVAAMVGNLHERLVLERSTMLAGQELPLLEKLKGLLEEEMGFDRQFSARFKSALDETWIAEDDLLPVMERLKRPAVEHFERRGSVVAFHSSCAAMQERIFRRSLQLVEEWMALNGFGSPPGLYCLFLSGYCGRRESTFFSDYESLLVFDEGLDQSSYFQLFAGKAEEFFARFGLHGRIDRGSIYEWNSRMSEDSIAGQKNGGADALVRLADISFLCGDQSLACQMQGLVRRMLSDSELLRFMGNAASEMPTGLDFFGRLRVEKSGMCRGMFDIEQYALEPLIKNIRILSVKREITATGTVDRIRELTERGAVSADLAERLLFAYHEFTAHKIRLQNKTGGKEVFLDPERLNEQEEKSLKAGLDSVMDLQRIVYQRFAE